MTKEKYASSIQAHRHCIVCSKPIAMDQEFCSKECAGTLTTRRKAQKRSTWIFMGVLGAMAVIWLLIMPMLSRRPTP